MPKLIDLSGKTFGSVYVVDRAPNQYTSGSHLRVMWNCICLECGKHFVTDGQSLRRGQTISCGCIGAKKRGEAARNRRENLVGETYNWLFVDSPAEDRMKSTGKLEAMWNCICLLCGNKTTASSYDLKSGNKKSDGCYRATRLGKECFKSLVGKRFSELYVESQAESRMLPNGVPVVMYNCICTCGERVVVSGNNLRSGNTKSCGHIGCSTGEYTVLQILKENKILYNHDSGFSDLKTSHGGYPRFDFKILNKDNEVIGVIEIQGLQHYKEMKNSDFGQFQREETDKLKKEYCIAHNIPLYEIRYDENYKEKTLSILRQLNVLQVNPVPSEQETA